MLGLVLLYFIGRYFYRLAEKYKKNKWLFAIIGVATYYAGTFVAGIILALLNEFLGLSIDWDNDLLLSVLALPFGILATYALYYFLNKNWEKHVVFVEDEIQDIGKSIEE